MLSLYQHKEKLEAKPQRTADEQAELDSITSFLLKLQAQKDEGFRRRIASLEPGEEYHGPSWE